MSSFKIAIGVCVGLLLFCFISCVGFGVLVGVGSRAVQQQKISSGITLDEYNQIKNGMSYQQVVSIIGVEGESISENSMDGIPGVMKSVSTKAYLWQNSDGSNMMVMFQNNKMIQKSQFGL